MTSLTLLAPDREVLSELKALSGQLESRKFFETHVALCPSDRRTEDVAASLRSRMNGGTIALVAVMGRDADLAVGSLEQLAQEIPVVLMLDPEGYALLERASPKALGREVVFAVY